MPKPEKYKEWGSCSTSCEHMRNIGSTLNELRTENKFCDVTIRVGGKEFGAHKVLLAASSCYFMTMFTSDFKEGSAKEIEIEGSAESFELMLQYIYTGDLDIYSEMAKPDLICGFLEMACYMQMNDAIETCTKDMHRSFDNSNEMSSDYDHPAQDSGSDSSSDCSDKPIPVADAFHFLLFAKMRDELSRFARLSEQYLQQNVKKLKKSDGILEHATVEFLDEFLSDEYLATAQEEKEVLEFVINWLKFDWQTRQGHTYRLLQKIRLGLVESNLRTRLLDDAICAIPECKALLDRVRHIEEKPVRGRVEQKYPDLFATRSSVQVAVTGSAQNHFTMAEYNKCEFKYFDINQQDWKPIDGFKQLPQGLCRHAVCYVKTFDNLYLAGGCERQQRCKSRPAYDEFDFGMRSSESEDDDNRWYQEDVAQRSFYWFDKRRNTWNTLPPMKKARSRFPLVHLGWYVYAIGGLHRTNLSSGESDIERYRLDSKKWEYVAPIRGHKSESLITAVAYKGIILAYGLIQNPELSFCHTLMIYYPKCKGQEGHSDECHKPNCNRWQTVLSEKRFRDSAGDMRPPTLFIHQDTCYKIVHHITQRSQELKSRPVVNVLQVERTNEHSVKVTIGEEVKQDFIPDNRAFAFRISDQVFATEWESVFDTGIKITADQKSDVDLTKIEDVISKRSSDNTSITMFPFDKRFLL